MKKFKRLKVIGYSIIFFIISIAIFVAGSILGVILAVLTTIATVFTGLWLMWFVTKDFSDSTKKDG